MLRLHFTDADLAKVWVAPGPDPLWETVLGVQLLSRHGPRSFAEWRRRARTELQRRGADGPARLVGAAAPPASYFPDFLTPAESDRGLSAGLDALRATPSARLRRELARTACARRLPRWFAGLAAGERGHLDELADAMRRVHDTVIRPDWTRVDATVEADRMVRARALRDGGVAGLLESLRPALDWRPPTLYVRYPEGRDIHLHGRGLCLVPSFFCHGSPVALADPTLPQVLVYPVARTEGLDAPPVGADRRRKQLAGLLGRTRARVLAALQDSATTGELARVLRISAASASEHVRALREVGLVHDNRVGGRVIHSLTPLGAALLHGDPQRPDAA
ncbi:winged helix-turn-helix domain-containing protein [Streptomyces sp. NPDC057575]|uniref:winged helix-turn-helix domain-containing protein n=1 Tax=unclassified Streptomyces TaxID=2593676 RepID=UPI003680CEC1